MSLARTALRMAAVEALAADPVIVALCTRDRIYDSRIDLYDCDEPVPVIVVLTEDDHGEAWSKNNGGPPFNHHCDLMLEISLRVVTANPDDPDGEPVLGLPETDADAEATLDLIEAQAVLAVTYADTPQAKLIRDAVLRRATSLKSIRFATAESGAKLALRVVTLTTELKIDQPDPFETPTGPFAALPQPLRAVAESLPSSIEAAAICRRIAGRLTPPTPAPATPAFVDVTIGVAPLDAGSPPDRGPRSADPVATSIDLSASP